MIERLRVFCAIELPKDVGKRVVDHIAQLRAAAPTARVSWARDEALHITLKFLGEIEPAQVSLLSKAAEQAARHIQPFTLSLESTGVFPTHGATRVLWIGAIDPTGNLGLLQQSLEDECANVGFAREERAFHPHLTIARQRAPQGAGTPAVLDSETQFQRSEFSVSEIVVMRSELRPEGSRYTKLSHALLQGA